MAYPPPPYADAVCGTHLCGEAICGTYWAYPSQPGLVLDAYLPAGIIIISGDEVPVAGLVLGAWVPDAVGQFPAPLAGLKLGAYAPTIEVAYVLIPTPAGLVIGAYVPVTRESSTISPLAAGLLLGAYLPDAVTIMWMIPALCADLDLVADAEQDFVLVGAASSDLVLDPQECR
jgi:hypothetical protein